MNYLIITCTDSWQSKKFEVDIQEIDDFREAKNILSKYFDMECIYDHIIEEFWEYRNKMDYWSLRYSSRSHDFILNHEIRRSLNRLVLNILNLSKLYLDRHYHKKSDKCFAFELSKNEEYKKIIEKQREKIYESNIEYAVCCELRNKAQHKILPVNTFTKEIRNDMSEKRRWVTFKIIYSYKELLNLGISQKLLSHDMQLDLTQIMNGYIYAISEMHFKNRELTEESVCNARKKIKNLIEAKANSTGYEKHISEFELDNGDILYAGLEWFEVVEHLKTKHPFPIDYSRITFDEKPKNNPVR